MQQISCSADPKDLYYLFSSIHASVHHAGGAFCSMGNFKEISSIEQKRRMKLLHLIRQYHSDNIKPSLEKHLQKIYVPEKSPSGYHST